MAGTSVEVQVGASGRLVIPAEFRHQLGLQSGDRLVARIDDDRLIFERADVIKQRIKKRFSHLKGKGIVDELIAQRRAEAAKE